VKDSAFNQRGLCPAVATLKYSQAVSSVPIMMITAALWAPVSFWPTGILKGCFTLLFLAIFGEELIQAHAGLKLNPVFLHGGPP
jgi:hypothetical protein